MVSARQKTFLFLSSVYLCFLFLAPSPAQALFKSTKKEEILVTEIREITLLGSSSAQRDGNEIEINGIVFCDLWPPGPIEKLANYLSFLFIGEPLRRDSIDELKKEIVHYYCRQGHPFINVSSPNQDITEGTICLIVQESKIDKITICQPKHFSIETIQREVHLEPGDPIDNRKLSADLSALNRNPFRKTRAVLSPGEEPWTTNITLMTEDRYPFRFYAGSDNTGNPVTEKTRWFAGINWGNAFSLGHIASFQWTASLDLKKMMSYVGSYAIPFSWGSTLTALIGFSEVDPGLAGLASNGNSAQLSGRYKIPLYPLHERLTQELTFGYDYKQTNNNLAFAATPSVAIETKTVELSQGLISYFIKYGGEKNTFSFWFDLYASPFQKWFKNQNAAAYGNLQPGATPIYTYGLVTFNDELTFFSWSLYNQGRFQLSSNTLLPSEQFGLGEHSTVRGYQERLVNFDNALCWNIELRSPSVSFFKLLKSKRAHDSFYALIFLDLGYGFPHQTETLPVNQLLDPPDKTLVGIGPGVRYSIGTYMVGRFDLGIPLTQIQANYSAPHAHFSLLFSY